MKEFIEAEIEVINLSDDILMTSGGCGSDGGCGLDGGCTDCQSNCDSYTCISDGCGS